jgi:hypothetical protein
MSFFDHSSGHQVQGTAKAFSTAKVDAIALKSPTQSAVMAAIEKETTEQKAGRRASYSLIRSISPAFASSRRACSR